MPRHAEILSRSFEYCVGDLGWLASTFWPAWHRPATHLFEFTVPVRTQENWRQWWESKLKIMEQKKTYVYLSMFNDVNVCKCLMSQMQIEANVHGVHMCLHALVCINSSAGARQQIRSVIFWNLQNATCFPRKDTWYAYTMYRLCLPKMKKAHGTMDCCLNATGSQPEVTTHCAQCLPLANSPLATWDTQDTQPPNLNIFKTRQILRNDQPHNSRNDHLFSFTDTNPNVLTMQ